MLILIAACEVGFWLILAAGLLLRYLTPLRRAANTVLACVPATDLVLLAATVIHLHSGAAPQPTDGLAAVYLGVSIAFGPTMLKWADARFAHRFAGAPPAPRPPKYGREHARHERRMWLRHLLAFSIGSALLLAATLLTGGPHKATPLLNWIPRWAIVLLIDAVWSFSYSLFPRKPRARATKDTNNEPPDRRSRTTPPPRGGESRSARQDSRRDDVALTEQADLAERPKMKARFHDASIVGRTEDSMERFGE